MTNPLVTKHLLNINAYEQVALYLLNKEELDQVLNVIQEKLLQVSLGIYYSDTASALTRLSVYGVIKDLVESPGFSNFTFKQKLCGVLLISDLLHTHKHNISLFEYLGSEVYRRLKSKEFTKSDAEISYKRFISEDSVHTQADFRIELMGIKNTLEAEFESIKGEEIKFIANLEDEKDLYTLQDNVKFFEYFANKEALKNTEKNTELMLLTILPFYFNKYETLQTFIQQSREVDMLYELIKNPK